MILQILLIVNNYQAINQYNVTKDNEKYNQGLKKINCDKEGIFISIDMCPSANTLKKDLFLLLKKKSKFGKIYITIAITGLWILQHKEEFKWLQSLKSGTFIITWVNHSFGHRYYKDIDIDGNFLLLKDSNIESEILDTEKILLEQGEVPSTFFRFPGLISDQSAVNELTKLGLIQLGASAWISKMYPQDEIDSGDIILIHGNGNEENATLKKFYAFLEGNDLKYLNLSEELSKNIA